MAKTGSKLTDMSEGQLALEGVKGNQMAFVLLYERYRDSVTAFVRKMVHNNEETEDIVMESFQKAFSQIANYNSTFRFSTWIFNIARNTALDHCEKSGRVADFMPTTSIDDEKSALGGISASTGNPETDVISDQGYEKLVAAIDGLSPTYREVARLVLLENFGYKEVSAKTGLELNTVKTRVKRARECLVKVLSEDEEEHK